MADIVDVAIGEIGYKEQGKNQTKYGKWIGMNGASWCHIFVSWCANQAGVSTSIVPKTASTSAGMSWFQKKGLFQYKGKYTPKRGDIIYFKSNGASHVGIVEKVVGNQVHTIEGNTSNKVARRSYSLSNARITGYGTPKYANGTSGSSKADTKSELEYLKKILEKKKPIDAKIEGKEVATYNLPKADVTVLIQNGKNKFTIPVKDGMQIVFERKGMPGKLTFQTIADDKLKISEGNAVLVTIDKQKFFYGFIFSMDMTKDGFISCVAYDQIRYLKAKDTIIYENKTATEIVKQIAKKFNLKCGTLADTKYKMSAIKDDTSMIDIIQNALDETLLTKNTLYVFFDNVGKLQIKNVANMKVNNCIIDEETAEDYSYKTSIDENVYNQIKLFYENTKKGSYDVYISKNTSSINSWGLLQYLEKIDNPDIGKLKSQAYLKLYCQKKRGLTIKNVIGNCKVRAGSLVPIMLQLYDKKIANYMLVEKVTHTFNKNDYKMDLIVSGGEFVA